MGDSEKKNCPVCGKELDVQARFCSACGAEQIFEEAAEDVREEQAEHEEQTEQAEQTEEAPVKATEEKDGLPTSTEIFGIAVITALLTFAFIPFMSSGTESVSPKTVTTTTTTTTTRRTTERTAERYTTTEYQTTTEKRGNYGKSDNGVYYEGNYNIGNDIPEGWYILVSNLNNPDREKTMFSIYATPDNSDYSSSFEYSAIVNISGHGYIDLSCCDAYPYETFSWKMNPSKYSGMFRVGFDIDEGTYRVVPSDDEKESSWVVFGDRNEIDYNKKRERLDGEECEITLKDGEIIMTEYCLIEKIS